VFIALGAVVGVSHLLEHLDVIQVLPNPTAQDLLLGYTGLLSFGHAAFWGSSAYTTGLVAIHLGAPFPVAVLLGAALAMVLAVPIGVLSVRRSGIYFAMVTLAFAQMIFFIANRWRDVTGGENVITLRGIGSQNTTSGGDSPVAYNVDGVYLARTTAVDPEFFDIERIEVLRGPQGTLFGKNTSAGVRKPRVLRGRVLSAQAMRSS